VCSHDTIAIQRKPSGLRFGRGATAPIDSLLDRSLEMTDHLGGAQLLQIFVGIHGILPLRTM
jgi:hypothetical protein